MVLRRPPPCGVPLEKEVTQLEKEYIVGSTSSFSMLADFTTDAFWFDGPFYGHRDITEYSMPFPSRCVIHDRRFGCGNRLNLRAWCIRGPVMIPLKPI